MKTILVLGAGRSSSSLIAYLLHQAERYQWNIIVADASLENAREKAGGHKNAVSVAFDIQQSAHVSHIAAADIVISLLPPPFHPLVASHCLRYEKHLLTASYVSDEMKAFDAEARAKGLTFLNECGLDPGIDHMSAMQIIHAIGKEGGSMVSFESFTGGLIAPETDPSNPWRYKFTWNPKNVVMAGQGTARFLSGGRFKYIPYQQLFSRITKIEVPGFGEFEGYANRDSLKYIDTYELSNIKTMLRGTLRNKGFCSAWNVFVQLGCCDDAYQMEDVMDMTHAGFMSAFLPGNDDVPLEKRLQEHRSLVLEGHETELLKWSGFFDNEPVGLDAGTPAQILEHILNKKWKLQPHDRDQIVMWHRFVYEVKGIEKEIQATLVATGTDSLFTAMAKTVGLPLGIAAKLLIEKRIRARGVVIPTIPEIYEPVLKELGELGIEMSERQVR